MDVKEKLVELLKTDICPSPLVCDPACRYSGCDNCFPERYADHLIANGVTVQEWISVKDRLPEKNTDVLVCTIEGYIGSDFITKDGKWFWNKETPPSHWMPLPEPPKGE